MLRADATPARLPPMLRYETIPVTPFQQNCSLIWCDRTQEAAVIDPGGEIERIVAAARRHGVRIAQVLLTHAHIDHAGGAAALARALGVPIVGPHPGDRFWIDGLPQQGRMFGVAAAESFTPARWLADGDTVQVGEVRLTVRHTPGHTPGHVIFHDAETKRAFVGDVLFAGSIGRTDFPGGDHDTLIASITGRLWPLGDDTVFVPGHGPESTFGRERHGNPYVGGS
jgi:glyoxylase-like metal-dependent hydrolase (beta-lactamase superfamily II)